MTTSELFDLKIERQAIEFYNQYPEDETEQFTGECIWRGNDMINSYKARAKLKAWLEGEG